VYHLLAVAGAVVPSGATLDAMCDSREWRWGNPNAIERMFCRLKDFRRVATRYDRNAVNFLAAVCIAAAISYRL
jgi:transposase